MGKKEFYLFLLGTTISGGDADVGKWFIHLYKKLKERFNGL